MKLLILTQKIDQNDDILGFFHGWVAEFAKHCEQVTVICLYKGEYDLPVNVKVLSLGKEESKCKIKYLFRFYKHIWQERKSYDAVFVHMNQIYVILGGFFWRVWRKKISLWYTHKQVSPSLRLAEKLVNNIFTASQESFRLPTKKVQVMGHGINTEIFKPLDNRKANQKFSVLTVGRISPIKDIKTLVRAMAILKEDNIELKIVGAPGTPEQEEYLQEIKDLIQEIQIEEKIIFCGSIPNHSVREYYQKADLFVNLAPTGGLDKAILEAMACACPVIVCNETVKKDLGEFTNELFFVHGDANDLAEKIKNLLNSSIDNRQAIANQLRQRVVENHNLEKLIKNILTIKQN